MDPYEHPPAMHQPPKRPVWRIVVGISFLVLSALAVLGTLASVATGNSASPENGAEALGALFGTLCCIGVPLLVGILLLALPPKRRDPA